jgi:hypothetical protein
MVLKSPFHWRRGTETLRSSRFDEARLTVEILTPSHNHFPRLEHVVPKTCRFGTL